MKKVQPISKDIYSLEIINVDGHIKNGKYVGSHAHLNATYLLEADETDNIKIKEDENSGVKWFHINEILDSVSEEWVKKNVYSKIIEKMRNDKII